MDNNLLNHTTEDKVRQISHILNLGRLKVCGNHIHIKCPFCRHTTPTLSINMDNSEYCCLFCESQGNFDNLDIELLGYSSEEETYDIFDLLEKDSSAGSCLCFHFVNKNLDDILSLARFTPSLISVKNNNSNDFELLYYFSNLKENTAQYKVIALRLLCDFEKLMSKRKISDKNFMDNYSVAYANDVFYKVIDHYSDSQLNSLIELFGNRLNDD